MDWKQQYLSKGFYQHAQVGNPVSVKNYIFLRDNNKKYLLIRYANELDHTVHAMYLTLLQLDATGKVIDRVKLKYEQLQFMPGSTYAEDAGIRVHETCTDFRVVFTKVISGQYEYSTYAGRPVVRYLKKQSDLGLGEPMRQRIVAQKVRKRTFGKPGVVAAAAVIAVVFAITVNTLGTFVHYYEIDIPKEAAKVLARVQDWAEERFATEEQTQMPEDAT